MFVPHSVHSYIHCVANLNFEFPQVVWQHMLGVVGYTIWVLFTICSSLQR